MGRRTWVATCLSLLLAVFLFADPALLEHAQADGKQSPPGWVGGSLYTSGQFLFGPPGAAPLNDLADPGYGGSLRGVIYHSDNDNPASGGWQEFHMGRVPQDGYAGNGFNVGYYDSPTGAFHSIGYGLGGEIIDTNDPTTSDIFMGINQTGNPLAPAVFLYGNGNVSIGSGNGYNNPGPGALRVQAGTRVIQAAPTSAPTGVDLNNGQLSLYVDETGKAIKADYKDSGGTVRTATLGTWP